VLWRGNRLPCQQLGPQRPLLRMLWRVFNTIRKLFQYGRPPGSHLGQPAIRTQRFGLTAIQVLDRPDRDRDALCSNDNGTDPISGQAYWVAALQYVNQLTSAETFFFRYVAGRRL
jgi:hypothetical protein